MPNELVVMIVLFILLSLLERIVRKPGEAAGTPEGTARRPDARPAPMPGRKKQRRRPTPEAPQGQLPEVKRETVRPAAIEEAGPAPVLATGSKRERRRTGWRLRDAGDLRRAVVLAAVLGPPRASQPYSGAEN